MRINEATLSLFAFKLLLIALLVDIGGGFGVKYAALGFALLISFQKIASHGVSRHWWHEGFFILYFLTAGGFSMAAGTPAGGVYGELSFLAFFLLLILLHGLHSEDIFRAFLQATVLGACMVIALYLLLYFIPDIGRPLAEVGAGHRLGYLGYRPGFDGLPNVYFRWSVWLVLGLALALASRARWLAVMIALAGILTTSTAIISMLVFILVGYIAVVERRVRGMLKSFLIGGAVLSFALIGHFLFGGELADFVMSKFSPESISTSVKLGHIESVLKELAQSLSATMFGQGAGTLFFSVGVGHEVGNIEVSYFHVLRQYGVFGVALVMGYIAFVIKQIARCGNVGKAWALGLIGMFFVAGTNPLLLSPLFFVPLLIARTIALASQSGGAYAGK